MENQSSVSLRPFLLQPSSYQVWVQAIARTLYEAGHGSVRFFMPSKNAIIAYHRASSRLHFQCFMEITIEIPDEIAQRLDQAWGSLSRRLLEIVVADAYRCGEISTAEVQRILLLPTRLQTHAFLKRMGVYLNYDKAELEQDLQTLDEFRTK